MEQDVLVAKKKTLPPLKLILIGMGVVVCISLGIFGIYYFFLDEKVNDSTSVKKEATNVIGNNDEDPTTIVANAQQQKGEEIIPPVEKTGQVPVPAAVQKQAKSGIQQQPQAQLSPQPLVQAPINQQSGIQAQTGNHQPQNNQQQTNNQSQSNNQPQHINQINSNNQQLGTQKQPQNPNNAPLPEENPALNRFIDVTAKLQLLDSDYKSVYENNKNYKYLFTDFEIIKELARTPTEAHYEGVLKTSRTRVGIWTIKFHSNISLQEIFHGALDNFPYISELLNTSACPKDEALKQFKNERLNFIFVLGDVIGGYFLRDVLSTASLDAFVNYLAQLVVTLQHIHARGIIILGMNINNIAITEDKKQIRIYDFSKAKAFKPNEVINVNEEEPDAYYAPEVHDIKMKNFTMEIKGCGYASDVFSLGMVMYSYFRADASIDLEVNYAKCTKNSEKQALKEKYINLPLKPTAPPEAVQLFKALVQPDPKQRPTIPQIMKHKFFDGHVDWYSMNILKKSIAKVKNTSPKKEVIKKQEKNALPSITSFALADLAVGNKIITEPSRLIYEGTLKTVPATIKVFKLSDKKAKNRFRKDALHLSKLQKAPFTAKLLWWTELTVADATAKFSLTEPVGVVVLEKVKIDNHLSQVWNGDSWDQDRAKKWMSQLSIALQHIHAQGIIYRDLHPEVIAITGTDDVCLWDFQNSKRLKLTTFRSSHVNKPEYVAPEVYLQTGYNYQVDVFSLGLVFYHFLAPKSQKGKDLIAKTHAEMTRFVQIKDLEAAENLLSDYAKLEIETGLPPGAHDLFKLMVQTDPNRRITLQAMFSHDYFSGVRWKSMGALEEKVHKLPIGGFRFKDVAAKYEVLPRGKTKLLPGPGYAMSDFRLEKTEIGSGAFAKVIKALDLKTNKAVAVKVYSQTNGSAKMQFFKDVLFLSSLAKARFICKLLFWGTLDDAEAQTSFGSSIYKYVLVLEFASQGDLKEAWKAQKYDQALVRKWMSQLVVAIQHIQANGIFHRDLKLDNILLTDNDDVRICDFGLSRRFQVSSGTRPESPSGTLLFMPPETHLGKRSSYAWDVFSLGVIFYHFIAIDKKQVDNMYASVASKNYITLTGIKNGFIDLPISSTAPYGSRELYRGMVHPDPAQRLKIHQIMQSEYFSGINWKSLGALEKSLF